MSTANYRRVIQQWCDATGMSPWSPEDDMHIDIADTTIGLVHDAHASPDFLHVYFDLGQWEFPDIHRCLLQENLVVDRRGNACFGLHPETGSIVYRLSILLTVETDGATLPDVLAETIDVARQRLLA
jgi:hypothetical protein